MKPIGGFFELEIAGGKSLYHDKAIKLTTGRACLNYILNVLNPKRVYVPYYCCDALFEPMGLNGIDYKFYRINEQLEIRTLPKLNSNEIILYTDFFGIKSSYVNTLINHYHEKLVIDNTHSYFLNGYTTNNYSFTSARKYFGVPDGAFLYGPNKSGQSLNIKRNNSISVDHNLHRLLGLQERSYQEFLEYEKKLGSGIEQISLLSEKVLSTLNYSAIRKRRNTNFQYFHQEFGAINKMKIDPGEKDSFCYPLLLEKSIDRKLLYSEKIYLPNLWLDTVSRKEYEDFEFECALSREILPLPIDHRYNTKDLRRISISIKRLINEP